MPGRRLHLLAWMTASALWATVCVAQPIPKKYALVVGIDLYQMVSDVPKLAYAVRDAMAIQRVLAEQGFEVVMLPDDRADRRKILGELLKYAEIIHPADTFLIYLAGHGVRKSRTKQVYWLNYDTDPRRPDFDGLRLRHLVDLVNEIPAEHKIIMLDHCFSGNIEFAPPAIVDSNTREAPVRGLPELNKTRDAIPEPELARLVKDAQPGTYVLSASRGAAYEYSEGGHGLMTHVLLQALEGPDADQARDGALSIDELSDFIYRGVVELSARKNFTQTPHNRLYANDDGLRYTWKPFLRQLQPTERAAYAERYRKKVVAWISSGLITEAVRVACTTALEQWAKGQAISQRDRRIVNAIREFVDGAVGLRDEQMATGVSDRVNLITQTDEDV